MVEAAESDVVGPSVTTKDPDRAFDEEVLEGGCQAETFISRILGHKCVDFLLDDFGGCLRIEGGHGPVVEALADQALERIRDRIIEHFLEQVGQELASGVNAESHTESKLGIVLKQGVCPTGAFSSTVLCIGRGREGAAIDGGASGRIGNDHPVPEELGHHVDVADFSTTLTAARVFEVDVVGLNGVGGNEFLEPRSNTGRATTFFETFGAGWQSAIEGHLRDREQIALETEHRIHDFLRVCIGISRHNVLHWSACDFTFRNRNHLNGVHRGIDGIPVHLDDFFALLLVGLFNIGLDHANRFFFGKHSGELEEGGLHHSVDALSEASLLGDLGSIHVVYLDLLFADGFLHFRGELGEYFLRFPTGIEQEGAAFGDSFEDVVFADVIAIVKGDEVGVVEQVFRLNVVFAETQVGNGVSTRLIGVILEVSLHEEIRAFPDDLDRVLVSSNCSIGSIAPELAAYDTLVFSVDLVLDRDGEVGDVVFDPDRKAVVAIAGEVIVDRLHHGRREFLRAQPVATADDRDRLTLEGCDCVQIERVADCTRFLDAVEHRDLLHRCRNRFHEIGYGERTVEDDLECAYLFAAGVEVADGFVDGFSCRTHRDNDAFRIRITDVSVRCVAATSLFGIQLHVAFDDSGSRVVEAVNGFATLEEDIRVLGSNLEGRAIGRESATAEVFECFPWHHRLEGFVVDLLNLLNGVRCAESVKEMNKGNLGFEGGKVGYRCNVLCFLDIRGCHESESGGAAGHHVRVISENRKRLACERTGGYVEDRGNHFTGDLEHVRDHQEQTL